MTQIFVGNLPHSATESELRSLFSRYGRVASIQIKTDIATNRPRGFAFVLMPSMEDADEAIFHLAGSSMNGRPLTVNASRNRGQGPDRASGDNSARDSALQMFEAMRTA